MSQDASDTLRRCVECGITLRDTERGWIREHKSFGGCHICIPCHEKGVVVTPTPVVRRIPIQPVLQETMGNGWWTARELSKVMKRNRDSVASALNAMLAKGMVENRWGEVDNGRGRKRMLEWRLKDGA